MTDLPVYTTCEVVVDDRSQGIGGSDVAGVVYKVGSDVTNVKVGDEVIVHHGHWDPNDPWVKAGKDPMLAPSAGIWGYNINFGSFGQFCIAQAHSVLPKATHLTWEEAAAPTLCGTTAYRMLHGWKENEVQKDDVVLVWGGSGGVGSQAIQIAKAERVRHGAVFEDDGKTRGLSDLVARPDVLTCRPRRALTPLSLSRPTEITS